jgi:hypothetical protein
MVIFAQGTVLVALAQAQIGTAAFTWQASTDNGSTWQSGRIEVPRKAASVRARAFVSWSDDAGYAFHASFFEPKITSVAGAGRSDSAADFARAFPFPNFINQMIVARRTGDVLRVSDSRDANAPGAGTFGVRCLQAAESSFSPFTRLRPLSIFEFTLLLDGSVGERVLDHTPLAFGQPPRNLSIYTTPGGQSNGPLLEVSPLSIVVIPSPASISALLGVLLLAARRRRPERDKS